MNLDSFQYLVVKSLIAGKLRPVNKFMDEKEISNVTKNYEFKKKFFPLPIIFPLKKIPKKKAVNLFYKQKKINTVFFDKFFPLKKKIIKNIIGSNNTNHPLFMYYSKFPFYGSTLQIKILKKNKKKNNHINFATRNSPHEGHKKILKTFLKKYKKITVSITTNNTINEFKKIKRKYDIFINKENLKNRISVKNFLFPSLKLGPREAALQTITRINTYGGHMLIGRDHSGYNKIYNEMASFKFCKKYEKKMKTKIVYTKAPFYCIKCNNIKNRDECNHWKNKKYFLDISNTEIDKFNEIKKKFLYKNSKRFAKKK